MPKPQWSAALKPGTQPCHDLLPLATPTGTACPATRLVDSARSEEHPQRARRDRRTGAGVEHADAGGILALLSQGGRDETGQTADQDQSRQAVAGPA